MSTIRRAARPARGRRRLVVVAATVLTVGGAGGAAAYVNAIGGGTGTISAATHVDGVLIVGNASAPVLPGQPTPLEISLQNSNPFPARISTVSVSISSVTSAREICSRDDYAVSVPSAPPVDVPAANARGDGAVAWPDGSITLTMADRDQSDCIGARVVLRYTAS